MKRRYRMLLALAAVIGVPYYWLLIENRPGEAPPAPLSLADLRRLADAVPGPKPEAVAIQQVGWRRVPGDLFVAGSGLKRVLLSIQAAEVIGPWGSVMIDSGMGPDGATALGLERYLPDNQARIDAALRRVKLIVFTHEHIDHIGGLLRLSDFATVAPRALITPEQGPRGVLARTLPWPAHARVASFRYGAMRAVAPGVVLIRTPGHTPGSQMVYVRLASGREFLFTGDTATMARSWEETRARSRLVGDLLAKEDRAAVFAWLKAIRNLHREDPGLIIVPGHEADRLAPLIERHVIRWGFATPDDARPNSGVASAETSR